MTDRVEDLLTRLSREAESQAAALLAEARDAAQRSREDAVLNAERTRAAQLAERERVLRAEAAASLETERLAGRREVLEARQQAVERILARLEALLPTLVGDERYRTLAEAELREALLVLTEASGELHVPPVLAEWARARVPAGVAIRLDPSLAGFRLHSSDQRVVVQGTLQERLRRARAALAMAAAAALDGEG